VSLQNVRYSVSLSTSDGGTCWYHACFRSNASRSCIITYHRYHRSPSAAAAAAALVKHFNSKTGLSHATSWASFCTNLPFLSFRSLPSPLPCSLLSYNVFGGTLNLAQSTSPFPLSFFSPSPSILSYPLLLLPKSSQRSGSTISSQVGCRAQTQPKINFTHYYSK